MAEAIVALKREKTRLKTNFTKCKNRLLIVTEETPIDTARVHELHANLDKHFDELTACLEKISMFHQHHSNLESEESTRLEIETVNEQYSEISCTVYQAWNKGISRYESQESLYSESNSVPVKTAVHEDFRTQLKRVEIPKFYGDKRKYESWNAAFMACIDKTQVSSEYKLLQLRQSLQGEALKAIDDLGYSAKAYESAKLRLERKFGGERRKMFRFLEDLSKFAPLRNENPKLIEKFADILDIAVINMTEAGRDNDLRDGSLYLNLLQKLPESMLTRYHRYISENKMTESVQTLRDWVNKESSYLMIASETKNGFNSYDTQSRAPQNQNRTHFGENKSKQSNRKCVICGQTGHNILNCGEFTGLNIHGRWNKAKEHRLCFRCLKGSHRGLDCYNSKVCGINNCEKVHHPLLHSEQHASQAESAYHSQRSSRISGHISLRTIPVILTGNNGRTIQVNALLDDGSTKSYLNNDVASILGLSGDLEKVKVNVLNGKTEIFETMAVKFGLNSISGSYQMNMEAQTTNNVTGSLKPTNWKIECQRYKHLQDVPFVSLTRDCVDLLIGLDYSDVHKSICEISGDPGEPVARLTPLGWTCVGVLDSTSEVLGMKTFTTFFTDKCCDIDRTLEKFWNIENCNTNDKCLSPDEIVAVSKAEKSLSDDHDFYKVSLPWKDNKCELKNNYKMAVNRLKSTERKLRKDEQLFQTYDKTIHDYVEKGYIKKLDSDIDTNLSNCWYMPHFPVVRPDKDTTKVRIVFDASAKIDNLSLNDVIHTGPKLQNELFDVLLRFRRYPVAIVCDVAEMYLRVGLNEEDHPYHRFLWRKTPDSEPDIYEYSRLVFGVNASPFLAQFVAQQNATRYSKQYPLAAETVLKSTYMDDGLDSVQTVEQCIELYRQLINIWKRAGMHVRKWLSNSTEVLKCIPMEDRASQIDLSNDELPSIKTLGVLWNASSDSFTVHVNPPSSNMTFTKRNFLKTIASIFDPIGLILPYVMRAKVLMQDIWVCGIDWDNIIEPDIMLKIEAWLAELCNLRRVHVSRYIGAHELANQIKQLELHVFTDASITSYGAVIYARCLYIHGEISTRFVAAKGRVAPLETISIPRLELMGAVLGVRLAMVVCRTYDISIKDVILWCDSMNVLFWIRNQSRRLKPFVGNRVGEIHRQTHPKQWRYVPTSENPADIITRGISAADMENNEYWWHGPRFLGLPQDKWPENKVEQTGASSVEFKKCKMNIHCDSTFVMVSDVSFKLDPLRYSSWLKLIRICSWVYRFVNNCLNKKICGSLTSDELRDSEKVFIKYAQQTFSTEITCARNSKKLPVTSKILTLNPKLDEDGILRVDSRLKFGEYLPYDVRFPVILPRRNHVTSLIVKYYHELRNHGGTNDVLSAISSRYWVIHAREEIRDLERNCMTCRRLKAKPCGQIMAPLPKIRLDMPLRAFAHVSVDFGGPFITIQGRGKRREKRYLCLFTCLASRAVHLEMAYGLDTNSFINAFYRMVNRRGCPLKMLSDRGTNFIGADRELKELVNLIDINKVQDRTANRGVKWQFNPPYAPHWGGCHETMIKSAKRAIYNILRGADVTDEELCTAFTGAEALINSRPLTYQSTHTSDCTPLTPNHFLFGQSGGEFAPEISYSESYNPIRRWRRVQELIRHFWKRWLQEWLPSLSTRKKWNTEQPDLSVNDVVLVVSRETPRGLWPLGRIVEVYRGRDGHVRSAKVRVKENEIERPISRLCLLDKYQV